MRCVGVWLCLAGGLLARTVGAWLSEPTNEAHEPILGTASEQAKNGADDYCGNADWHSKLPQALNERF